MNKGSALVQCLFLSMALSVSAQGEPQPPSDSYLHDPTNIQNKQHIKEHMSDYYKEGDMDEQLDLDSEESTRFHYFKLHDYDHNNKLDGLELYAAIAHYAEHHGDHQETAAENAAGPGGGGDGSSVTLEHEQVTELVDAVLKQDDLNEDGFVDYYEFVRAQQGTKEENNV